MFKFKKENLVIIELDEERQRDLFHCENEDVNKFFKGTALYNHQHLLSKIYLYVNRETEEIVGFISLSAFQLNLANKIKYNKQQIPSILLGRLGIDDKYRGQDLGLDLIKYAYAICMKVKDLIGCRLFIVQVKRNDKILNYFGEKGFIIEHSDKNFHYLSIDLLI